MIGKPTLHAKQHQDGIKRAAERLRHVADGIPAAPVRPLTSYPAKPHPRQNEIDGYRSIAAKLP